MKLLSYVSELLMPFLILYVVGYGLASRRDIYGDFMEGAKDGLKTAAGICPTPVSYTHLDVYKRQHQYC